MTKSIRGGARRLRVLTVAAAAALVVGLSVQPALADDDTDLPSPDAIANAELIEPMCAVPPNHDPAVIRTLYSVGESRGVNGKVMLAMFETGWVESHMQNLNCGDRDSLGVFQQRPSMGWCTPASLCLDVVHATNKFLDRAIPNDRNNPGYTPGQLAQSVQISAYPERYDQAEGKARALMAEASGSYDRERVSDFSGDGKSDVLGVAADGRLLYYPHSGNGFGTPKQIGHGWGTFKHVMTSDWSGDGHADVLGVDSAGKLWYYPHSGSGLGTRVQIGQGWGTFPHVM